MTAMPDYIRDPAAIYAASFATIEAEADLSGLATADREIAVRMIHSCGMPDLLDELRVTADFASAASGALAAGCPIYCDAQMVAHGIIRPRLARGNDVRCLIGEPCLVGRARAERTTRSAAQVDLWEFGGAVVVIGNAPTALFRLLERVAEGAPPPAAIIGIPVGFVGAAESKDALARSSIPHVTVLGRRGGSAMAAAALNAVAGLGTGS